MRKKIVSFMIVLVLFGSVCMAATAEETEHSDLKTASRLKSSGAIVYQEGEDKVRLDAEDLYWIADRLDLFKRASAGHLGEMHTYFTTKESGAALTTDQIYVTHVEPGEEAKVNPLAIHFDTLLEGIAASQSIPAELSEYGYPEGITLYRTKEGMLTDTFVNGAQKVTVASAAEGNLSAGTAAWVNGELLLRTGADNQSYYQNGYKEAYAKGYNEAYTKLSSQVASVDFIQYAGDLRTREDDHMYLGPTDVSIPNKDVWLLITGATNAIETISPAPDYKYEGYAMMLLQYRKKANLSDTATRSIHFEGGRVGSGVGVPYWIMYLK